MITNKSLYDIAGKFIGENPSPNNLVAHYAIILEAMQNNHAIDLALYYGYYFDLGASLVEAKAEAKHYKTEMDVLDGLKSDLEYYCKHGWEYKLEQLAAL